jgi:hypothetical protein
MKQITKCIALQVKVVVENWRLKTAAKRAKAENQKSLEKLSAFLILTHVTKMSLRSAGKTHAAELLNEALETAPTKRLRIRKA